MTQPADFLTCECPCDGCPNRQRCSDQRLACAQFSMFMANESAKRWRLAPRQPTREIYEATVGKPTPKKQVPRKPSPAAVAKSGTRAAVRFNAIRAGRATAPGGAVAAGAPDARAVMAFLKGEAF